MDGVVEPAVGRDNRKWGSSDAALRPGLGMGNAWVVGDVLKSIGTTRSDWRERYRTRVESPESVV